MTTTSTTTEETEALERRRGELAQGAQLALLEGLPVDDVAAEVAAIDEELARRRGPSR